MTQWLVDACVSYWTHLNVRNKHQCQHQLRHRFGFENLSVLLFGIVTRYELDGPGIEYRWVRDFLHASRPGLEPIQPPKPPGRDVNHPSPTSAEAKERVELYLYSSSLPAWPVLGRTVPFFCTSYSIR